VTKLWYFVRSACLGIVQTPFVHAVAVLTLGISLFASSLARSAFSETRAVLDAWGTDVQLTVYLDDAVLKPPAELVDAIRRDSEGTVTSVPKDEALARLKRELGDLGSVLDGLATNPLPATLEVRPGRRLRSAAAVRGLAARWDKLPGVTGVDYGREWIDRLEAWNRGLEAGGLIAAILIFGATIVVVAATLQLAVYARREEIEIQKLVGATDSFVKAPMVLEGVIQGLGGAALATAGLASLDVLMGKRIADAVHFVAPSLSSMVLATPGRMIEVIVAGVALGLVGSFLAVGRFLKV
jgi:cell division transport system permease protein